MSRIVLKLSGEALGNKENCFDYNKIARYAKEIKTLVSKDIEVIIVCGGGNIVRGRSLEKIGFDRVNADLIGMLATIMNAVALENALKSIGVKVKALSALNVEGITHLDLNNACDLLNNKTVLIIGGGVANPYFSTDSGAALRACEFNAGVILMGKNGVDGVYDSDPSLNPNAKRYEHLSFDDILKRDLKIIDATAAGLCRDNNIKAFVFNINEDNSIVNAGLGLANGTLID